MILDQLFLNKKRGDSKNSLERSREKPLRSVVKSLSWRIVGTIDTILISWFITGTLAVALSIGGIELLSKLILYFFHERVWNLIKWGT